MLKLEIRLGPIVSSLGPWDIEVKTFPGGEVRLKLPEYTVDVELVRSANVTARITNSEEFMALMMTVDAIRRRTPGIKINLFLPYMPYARQDRVCNDGEPLSVKVAADLINSLKLNKVTVLDPHSDVTPALLDNCVVVDQLALLKKLRLPWEEITLVAPDAGAVKKVEKLHAALGTKRLVTATKHRDTKTGYITDTTLDANVHGERLLVIDDIFDGGRTFLELGKVLAGKGVASAELFVTHGIFSQGYNAITEYFSHVYTTNSFHEKGDGDRRPDDTIDKQYTWLQV